MSGDDIVLGDYVLAPSGIGPLTHVWANEPFRLIYDLCHDIERLRAKNEAALLIISDLEAEVERLRAEVSRMNCTCLPYAELHDGMCSRCMALRGPS